MLIGYIDKKQKLEIQNQEGADLITAELKGRGLHRCQGHDKKGDPPAGPALHHQHPAAGSLAQAPLLPPSRPWPSPSSFTKACPSAMKAMSVLSPTCAPIPPAWPQSAVAETRDYIEGKVRREIPAAHARVFAARAKGAQEAHEAIRPTRIHREPAAD